MDFAQAKLASDLKAMAQDMADRRAMFRLQNNYNARMMIKDICRVLLGQPIGRAGQKLDGRKRQIPEGLHEGLLAILTMMAVTNDLRYKSHADKFIPGLGRMTSYEEIARIRGHLGICLSNYGVKR